jgi:RNA polymerase-interacting CarD/CdnL/TRCF family regulator
MRFSFAFFRDDEPGRKSKDDLAQRVRELKDVTGISWGRLTIKMNEEALRSGLPTRTEEAYRSLYRSRKKKGMR